MFDKEIVAKIKEGKTADALNLIAVKHNKEIDDDIAGWNNDRAVLVAKIDERLLEKITDTFEDNIKIVAK